MTTQSSPSPARRTFAQPAPLLRGRAEETAQVFALLQHAASGGHGAVVVISGAGGVGKTALLEAAVEHAHSIGYAVGSSKAEAIDEVTPGAPLLTALRSGPQPLLDSTEFAGLAALSQRPPWLVDRVADLLGDRNDAPLLLTVDDIQWADPLSLFALRVLPSRLSGSPVVWLLATRDWVNPRQLELGGVVVPEVTYLSIALVPLSQSDILQMATDRLGGAPTASLRRRLADVGGNPLLAGELVDGASLAGADDEALPRGLVTGVRRRLGFLSPEALRLVQAAAVFGRPFSIVDATAVLAADSPAQLFPALQEAVDCGVLVDDGDLISCRHDVLREAVYTDLVPSVQNALHRRCADYLMASGQGPIAAAPHIRASAAVGDRVAVEVLRAAARAAADAAPDTAVGLISDAYDLLP